MKKTAILIYDSFCNFEISTVLEILALAEKPITVFGITREQSEVKMGCRYYLMILSII